MAKKKNTSLDDFFDGLKSKHSKNLDESFKAYDDFNKTIDEWYVDVFAPAQDQLYATIEANIKKSIGSGKKVHNKEKELKKAVLEGLKEYFEKVHPSITKAMEDSNLTEDEQYKYLTGIYDEHIAAGAGGKKTTSIKGIAGMAADKTTKVEGLLKMLYIQKVQHAEAATNTLKQKFIGHHFSKYHPVEIGSYLKPKLEKAGAEIEDKAGYIQAELGDLFELRDAVIQKKGHKYLKKKEEENE